MNSMKELINRIENNVSLIERKYEPESARELSIKANNDIRKAFAKLDNEINSLVNTIRKYLRSEIGTDWKVIVPDEIVNTITAISEVAVFGKYHNLSDIKSALKFAMRL